MVSFIELIIQDGSPIYQQIVDYMKRMVSAGMIQDHEEMPSRRVLSAQLKVNPNTIQKAYRILEEEGLIESRTGAKSYVIVQEDQSKKLKEQMMENDARAVITSLKQMGITREEAIRWIRDYWDLV